MNPSLHFNTATVHVSRAFTCHQMLALVRELPRFAQHTRSRLILLPGLLDTFYDEAIPQREVKRIWGATMEGLKRLFFENLLLAICPDYPMETKRPLKPSLVEAADRVVSFQKSLEGKSCLHILKPNNTKIFELTFSDSLMVIWNFQNRKV